MKIDASVKSPGNTGIQEAAPRTSKAVASTPSGKKSATQDSVQITNLSSQLHALESSIENVPVVDSAKVEAIKQAISEGRFKINPEVIAERLLASVKDLVQNSKG